jgi:predicted MFS family arabinose efflux permease
MAAFSVASVLGVPAGLELAERLGWRAPFFAVAGLGLVITVAAVGVMPSMRGHLSAPQPVAPKVPLLDSVTTLALLNTALVTIGVFAVVPNISAFIQHNLGFPRGDIGTLYLAGGTASFVVMRLVGILVDRFGAAALVVLGTVLHAFALITAFVHQLPGLPIIFIFTVFMLSASVRMVPLQTLASRVPRPAQRARFMSTQSAVQHAASAVGAMLASFVLVASPDGKLVHMDAVALGALFVACLVPLGAYLLERRINARDAAVVV